MADETPRAPKSQIKESMRLLDEQEKALKHKYARARNYEERRRHEDDLAGLQAARRKLNEVETY